MERGPRPPTKIVGEAGVEGLYFEKSDLREEAVCYFHMNCIMQAGLAGGLKGTPRDILHAEGKINMRYHQKKVEVNQKQRKHAIV